MDNPLPVNIKILDQIEQKSPFESDSKGEENIIRDQDPNIMSGESIILHRRVGVNPDPDTMLEAEPDQRKRNEPSADVYIGPYPSSNYSGK